MGQSKSTATRFKGSVTGVRVAEYLETLAGYVWPAESRKADRKDAIY